MTYVTHGSFSASPVSISVIDAVVAFFKVSRAGQGAIVNIPKMTDWTMYERPTLSVWCDYPLSYFPLLRHEYS